MDKYIKFSCNISEDKNGKKCFNFGKNRYHNKIMKNSIDKYDNCICVITGKRVGNDGLLLIDFDNKESNDYIKNGIELFNIWKTIGLIDTTNSYYETTRNNGIHLYYVCKNQYFDMIKPCCNDLEYNGIKYAVDIKANNQFSIFNGTEYVNSNGEVKKYKLVNDKLCQLPKELENIITNNMQIHKKKVKKKQIVNVCKEFEDDKIDLDILEKIIDGYDEKTASKYETWIKIGIALKNSNKNSFYIFDKFSKLCLEKYNKNDCICKFNKLCQCKPEKYLSIRYLKWLLRKTNFEYYKKLFIVSKDKSLCDVKMNNKVIVNTKYIVDDNTFKFNVINNDIKKHMINFIFGKEKQIIAIKSQMNTGKTYLIMKLLELFPYLFKRVLYIVHRINLADDIYGKLKQYGFLHYRDNSNEILTGDKIIITVDSLEKVLNYNGSAFNLIVMDEIESLLYHFNSNTLIEKDINKYNLLARLKELIKKSKRLIAMDADFGLRGHSFLDSINKNYMLLWNEYNNNKRKLEIYMNDNKPIEMIKQDLQNNKKIVVITQSLMKGTKLIDTTLKEELKNKEYKFYSSRTKTEDKCKLINVNDEWTKLNLLQYTSSIDSGIDFNKEHYDKMYILCSLNTNSARAVIQMSGRIRNLKNETIVVCLPKQTNNKENIRTPFTYEEVKELLNFSNTIDDIFIYNELENLNKKYYFVETLINCATNAGLEIEFVETQKNKNQLDISEKERIEILKNMYGETYDKINMMRDVDYNNLIKRIQNGEDNDGDKDIVDIKNFMNKYKLYKINDNILYFYFNKYVIDNLKSLQNNVNEYMMDNEDTKIIEKKSKIINKFIDKLGFSLEKNVILTSNEYENNIHKLIKSNFYQNIKEKEFNYLFGLCRTHKLPKDNIETKNFNKIINNIFEKYGFTIRSKQRKEKKIRYSEYYLQFTKNINELYNNMKYGKNVFNPKTLIYNDLLSKSTFFPIFDDK